MNPRSVHLSSASRFPLYQTIAHIPLMMAGAGLTPGRQPALTTSVDLFATGLQNIRDRANALGALYQFNPGDGQPRHWLSLPLKDESRA